LRLLSPHWLRFKKGDRAGVNLGPLLIVAKIKIGNTEFDMLFNVNALDEIIKKYGGMSEMQKSLLNAKSELESIDAYMWIITLLINQAVLAHNLDLELGIAAGDKKQPITEQYAKIKLKAKRPFLAAGCCVYNDFRGFVI